MPTARLSNRSRGGGGVPMVQKGPQLNKFEYVFGGGGSHVICDWSMASHGTPAVNRQTRTQTHTTENITFPQIRWRVVKYINTSFPLMALLFILVLEDHFFRGRDGSSLFFVAKIKFK